MSAWFLDSELSTCLGVECFIFAEKFVGAGHINVSFESFIETARSKLVSFAFVQKIKC